MGLARVYSRALQGLEAVQLKVEVHVSGGLPAVTIVGLPEASVREARDRVRSAIINSGFEFPASRVTVNLAPADVSKQGSGLDLPIALGILAASQQINSAALDEIEVLGELALNGELAPVRGALALALEVAKSERLLLLPRANSAELILVKPRSLLSAEHLSEVAAALNGGPVLPYVETRAPDNLVPEYPDMADVKGQAAAKRALLVAAAGGHNVLMEGPPGSGKSMLAQRLIGILPPLTADEALQVAALRSLSAGPEPANYYQRPFRSLHHTASVVAMVGGANGLPGEISRAHRGLLFADEVTEFPRRNLEALRDPLENGYVDISRADLKIRYPANFQLVMAMNPCPCGDSQNCRDTPEQVKRYRAKLSGPVLDRVDVHIQVPAVKHRSLKEENSESSASMREQVLAARSRQQQRQNKANSDLTVPELQRYAPLCEASEALLERAMTTYGLSARGYHRLLKVARSIADLAGTENIQPPHTAEAISLRQLDRWQTG